MKGVLFTGVKQGRGNRSGRYACDCRAPGLRPFVLGAVLKVKRPVDQIGYIVELVYYTIALSHD
jgi:hypothetical protein